MLKNFTREYGEGRRAADAGVSRVANPYADRATDDNLARGMGGSPWWDTNYRPFIRWEQGYNDASFAAWEQRRDD